MNENIDDPLYKNIYPSMQEKETDELLRIWKENDREQWSDAAFEVVHNLLVERIGQVPEQAPRKEEKKEIAYLHNPKALLNISTWANILSWIILVPCILGTMWMLFTGSPLGLILFVLATGLFCFLVLQAIAKGMPLLLDILNNTQQLINASQSRE